MKIPEEILNKLVAAQPYPLLFLTICGAHLYGFSTENSEFDIRGCHIVPPRQIFGLDKPAETLMYAMPLKSDREIDLVTHDVKKVFKLLLKRNGYVLEQMLSPMVVYTSEGHQRLKELAPSLITRLHAHHYIGFCRTNYRLFKNWPKSQAKPLLYMLRGLLSGIHLMRTGQVEANLITLNEIYKLPYIPDLIERRMEGSGRDSLSPAEIRFFDKEYWHLTDILIGARDESHLPEHANCKRQLNELLIDLRFLYKDWTPPATAIRPTGIKLYGDEEE